MKKGSLAVSLCVFALLTALAVGVIGAVGQRSRASETEMVRESVRAAALTCYAVEGAYPASLDYLKAHYGLTYNERAYHVSYDAFASNIFPDIYVTEGDDAP